jgi:putative SOS response-associated peptidase YedK
MCVNYLPSKRQELQALFDVRVNDTLTWPDEVWKDYPAPIVRKSNDQSSEVVVGTYGIVPRRHIPEGVRVFDTMNARAETVGEKRSYSKAWREGQTCLVPMAGFFEPKYSDGKSERWRIALNDAGVFCVAGMWREWKEPDGSRALSFTQLTINADDHPFMRQFHKPGDEKRSLVIVPPDDYDAWLSCRDPEIARSFLTLYPANLMRGEPAPRPAKKIASSK